MLRLQLSFIMPAVFQPDGLAETFGLLRVGNIAFERGIVATDGRSRADLFVESWRGTRFHAIGGLIVIEVYG
ncbi:hypothetical protein AB4144_42760, partial [Rhizobiaceae sp. 2RAB30]